MNHLCLTSNGFVLFSKIAFSNLSDLTVQSLLFVDTPRNVSSLSVA